MWNLMQHHFLVKQQLGLNGPRVPSLEGAQRSSSIVFSRIPGAAAGLLRPFIPNIPFMGLHCANGDGWVCSGRESNSNPAKSIGKFMSHLSCQPFASAFSMVSPKPWAQSPPKTRDVPGTPTLILYPDSSGHKANPNPQILLETLVDFFLSPPKARDVCGVPGDFPRCWSILPAYLEETPLLPAQPQQDMAEEG